MRAEFTAIDGDATAAGEPSLPPDHFHSKLLESLYRVVWSNRVDDRAKMRVDTLKIDQRFRADPEGFRIANHLCRLGGGQQRFGGHTSGIETFAAHPILLDQDDADAELGGAGRHGQSRSAGADDAEVHLLAERHRLTLIDA